MKRLCKLFPLCMFLLLLICSQTLAQDDSGTCPNGEVIWDFTKENEMWTITFSRNPTFNPDPEREPILQYYGCYEIIEGKVADFANNPEIEVRKVVIQDEMKLADNPFKDQPNLLVNKAASSTFPVGVTEMYLPNLIFPEGCNTELLGVLFMGLDMLEKLDLRGWNLSSVTDMASMFEGCKALTELNVSGWDTSNATDMRSMFDGCEALTSLNLTGWDTSHVTDMSSMFLRCRALTSLDVSDWNTAKVTDMSYMFQGCTNLTSLDISNWNTSKVNGYADAFKNCTNLKTLTLGENSLKKRIFDVFPNRQGKTWYYVLPDSSSPPRLTIGSPLGGNQLLLPGNYNYNTMGGKWSMTQPENITLYGVDQDQLGTGGENFSYNSSKKTYVRYYIDTDLPITLPKEPTKNNCTFLGWTGKDQTVPANPLIIPEGTTGNKDYTAKWSCNVTITAEDQTITYDPEGNSFDPASMFTIKPDTITASYTVDPDPEAEDAGAGSFDAKTKTLTVTKAGKFRVTVNTAASDPYPGASAYAVLTVNKLKETTPNAEFTGTGTDTGKLTGLVPGAEYILTGANPETFTALADGTIELKDVSPGTITLVKKGSDTRDNSDPQNMDITQGEKPAAAASDCTTAENDDGKISGVDTTMQYRKSDTDQWEDCDGSVITGLEPGTYYVRVKGAVWQLASESQELVIKSYVSPAPTPETVFTATGTDTGILSGLETGATYTITGLVPNPFTFTASGTEQELTGVSEGTITIVNKGDGSTTMDSDPQELTVTKPEKPDASAADCTTAENNDGKLSGVTEDMEYRKAGTNEWISGTGSDITSLTPGAYFVRYKAVGTKLASESQELVINTYTGGGSCQVISPNIGFTATYDGEPHGITVTSTDPVSGVSIMYGTSEGSYPLNVSPTITDVEDSPLIVYYQITADGYAPLTGSAAITLKKGKEPVPPKPEPKGMDFFLLEGELPLTGITAPKGELKPLSVNYKPVNMELQIPGLNVFSEIVTVPVTADGYAVAWLGNDAGLLEGSALPGEGVSVIAGHNTLNAEEFGPFAAIRQMDEGERFFVRDARGKLMTYEVYANEKISSHDTEALRKAALVYDNTLTLLTCEDELPEGGYASRRIVSAKYIN